MLPVDLPFDTMPGYGPEAPDLGDPSTLILGIAENRLRQRMLRRALQAACQRQDILLVHCTK